MKFRVLLTTALLFTAVPVIPAQQTTQTERDLRAENGGGQYGLCFDDRGRKFVCSNSDHIQQVVYPRRYGGDGLPAARVRIAADGPAAEVFRRSPDEPWRVVRTRWRVGGLVGGPVEGGPGNESAFRTFSVRAGDWEYLCVEAVGAGAFEHSAGDGVD